MRIITFLCFCAVVSFQARVESTTYHVAQKHPGAHDENPGTQERPWKTISKAAETLEPGDTVIVHEGIYREWVHPKHSGTKDAPIVYEGAKSEQVIITGADIFTDWKHLEGPKPIYTFEPWTLNSTVHGADAPIGRQEQVIVDGKLLRHVLTIDEIQPGCFVSDIENDVLYVYLPDGDDPADHTVEVSVRNRCFGLKFREDGRDHIHVRGFIMRYGRNMAQRGILYAVGNNWIIEDNIVDWSNGCGMSVRGEGHIVRNNISRYNGQLGMGSGPVRCLFENNKLLCNNIKGYRIGWEAGGCKIVHAYETTMKGTIAIGNDGPGIWLDVDNRKSVVSHSICIDNSRSGIFIEISGRDGIKLLSNLCFRNGLKGGQWGGAGIKLGESESCTVEGNVLVGNKEGLAIRMQGPRDFKGREGEEVSYYTHHHVVRNNVIAFNRDYQLVFWGDNPFFGPHPHPAVNQKPKPLLDPEKLHLTIDNNVYFTLSGEQGAVKQALFLYGPTWRPKHELLNSLSEWQEAHRFDEHSVFLDPQFRDWRNGDFRLRPSSPLRKRFQDDNCPFIRVPEESP